MIRASNRLAAGLVLSLILVMPAAAQDLRAALSAAARGDWTAAAAQAPDPVGADIVEWLRLRAGDGTLTDYERFLARRSDWPGMPFLRRKGEEAVARSTTPDRVIAYFGNGAPATPEGAIALVTALKSAGRPADSARVAADAWVNLAFDAAQETVFLAAAPQDRAAHERRADRLLWDGRLAEARRMLPRLGAEARALAEARIALRERRDGVNALISAVPSALAGDPGLAHDRFQWRMNSGLYDSAAELILERSDTDTLGRAAAWAPRRANLARQLAEEGKHRTAWRVAASHGLSGGGDFADLEFLAGFIALRHMGDHATALGHFQRLRSAVQTPISLSRAHYWEGRAEEAAGRRDAARAAYGAASRHSSAYYGLLAAERLGQTLDPALLSDTRPADWRQAGFAGSSVLAAARMFLAAGDRTNGKRFLLHLAEGLDPGALDQLADMALSLDEPHVAVLIAKAAAERGRIIPRAYFPVPAMVPDGLPVSRALALSIARRESEFDPAVISPAGARGLMQVMPGTAEMMARETGQPYASGRLTTDPAYNVSLGAAYLKKLIDEFGPAVALVAAGYNAGPGRPRRWITEFGDPRDPAVDPVDWVEMVPIAETRTYIMRVVESLVIYRARLRGQPGPVRVTAELTGR
ncbi:MAG: lytic transglycosylase domain-containing protein [Paracoccaceae bacterium]|nr:MAG: lytic transglycosylase domain-containing protein [Paracoccaceae bacterium]